MKAQLVRIREHLEPHRRLITVRAMAASIVGGVPFPGLDDWLAAAVRRGTIRKLGDLRGVDLTEGAVHALADGPVGPPAAGVRATSTAIRWLLLKMWRKTMLVVFIAQRADQVGRDWMVFTLFDHYCARLHVGGAIQPDAARELRRNIDSVMSEHRARLVEVHIVRALRRVGRRALRMPIELAELVVGTARKALGSRTGGSKGEAAADCEVDDVVSRVAGENGFLADAGRAIEVEIDREATDFLGELIADFDHRVRSARR